jgi:hypothetical protein
VTVCLLPCCRRAGTLSHQVAVPSGVTVTRIRTVSRPSNQARSSAAALVIEPRAQDPGRFSRQVADVQAAGLEGYGVGVELVGVTSHESQRFTGVASSDATIYGPKLTQTSTSSSTAVPTLLPAGLARRRPSAAVSGPDLRASACRSTSPALYCESARRARSGPAGEPVLHRGMPLVAEQAMTDDRRDRIAARC